LFCYPGKVADRILGADLPGHDVGFEEESYFLKSSLECVFFSSGAQTKYLRRWGRRRYGCKRGLVHAYWLAGNDPGVHLSPTICIQLTLGGLESRSSSRMRIINGSTNAV
jgi:hypothetical protein